MPNIDSELTCKVHEDHNALQGDGRVLWGQRLNARGRALGGGQQAGPEGHRLGRQQHVCVLREGQHLQAHSLLKNAMQECFQEKIVMTI